MDQLDNLVAMIEVYIRAGDTVEQAYKALCQFCPVEQVRAAVNKYEEITGKMRTLKEPTTLEGRGLNNWYPGPSSGDRFWPPLKDLLLQKGWSDEAFDSLDKASNKVVSLLQPPGLGVINTRGLVLGYIQSGKTANFSAVIAKAADVGYKLFIVLSGLTDPLRNQTQHRLSQELTELNRSNWVELTFPTEDFRPGPVGNVNAFLTRDNAHRVLGVVKKNAAVLRRLLIWLKAAHKDVISNCPVLIIDDEADQASVNASGSEEKRTTINRLILEILEVLPKAAYVGYTATPFATVFIDPSVKDLYPRDFIIDLPRPANYFGAEQIFGRERLTEDDEGKEYDGFDMIRRIAQEEVPFLKPKGINDRYDFEPQLTPSLESALHYFWLATAARAFRGDGDKHSTMLIHTTLYTDVHERFKPLITSYQDQFLKKLRTGNSGFIYELRTRWTEEQLRVPPADVDETPVFFDELLPHLIGVVKESAVVVENSKSPQRLVYGDTAKIQIVIGGNTLARGLTLEGLVVSFFVRAANAFDTLLQMGRWFGYRPGYADLPRIWMTAELEEYFYDLATVEEEVRNDIKRYELEGLTPLQFGVRIRTHPALEITSRLKMQAAIDCNVSYSGDFRQTILFNHKDRDWLTRNLNAARSLIRTIRAYGIAPVESPQKIIFRDVPVDAILSFLKQYAFHEQNRSLSSKLLDDYIEAQKKQGDLLRWNVVVVTRNPEVVEDPAWFIDLGLSKPVPLLNRSRLEIDPSVQYANLGVIVNGYADVVADLDLSREELKGARVADLQIKRPPGVGLLLIYPISKDSIPMKGEKMLKRGVRKPLEAVEHLIGVALAFPRTENPTTLGYKTVDLSRVEREEEELPEEEEENNE